MWIFTKYGFYSVVCAHNEPDKRMVRARRREHLEALAKRFPELADDPIIQTPDADYRFRIIVPAAVISPLMAELCDEVDYTNFKTMVLRKWGDDAYEQALHDVWTVMYRIQPE